MQLKHLAQLAQLLLWQTMPPTRPPAQRKHLAELAQVSYRQATLPMALLVQLPRVLQQVRVPL
eukprot:scaffold140277_cov15-Tisochrysis_lutea.AAC.1